MICGGVAKRDINWLLAYRQDCFLTMSTWVMKVIHPWRTRASHRLSLEHCTRGPEGSDLCTTMLSGHFSMCYYPVGGSSSLDEAAPTAASEPNRVAVAALGGHTNRILREPTPVGRRPLAAGAAPHLPDPTREQRMAHKH